MTARRGIDRKASFPGARDRENFSDGEDFSCAEHEFFTSRKKPSRSWGLPWEGGRLAGLSRLMGRIRLPAAGRRREHGGMAPRSDVTWAEAA
jgi:hypothetical protein